MIEPIISGVFLAFAGIAAFLGFVSGMRKKWQYTILKVATTVMAAAIAIIVARAVPAQGIERLTEMIVGIVPEALASDVKGILTSPEVKGSVLALTSMILSPLLFSLLFIVIKPLLGIFKAPIARFWINKAEKNKTWNNNSLNYDKWGKKKLLEHRRFKMSSALLGAFSGVLLAYVISIPMVFGISITGKIAQPIVENFAADDPTLVELCDAAVENRAVTAMELTGGKAVYNLMTFYEIDGQFTHLDKEVNFLATSVRAVLDLTKTEGYDGAATKAAIDEMAAAFDKTVIMPSVISGVLHISDTKWDNGETFLGIDRPSLPEPFTPITDSVFEILSGDSVDALKADIGSVFKITGILCEKVQINAIMSDPLSVLSDKETNTKIFEELYTSDRLYTLVPAFAEAGVGVIADTLHFHEDAASNYVSLTEAILAAAQNPELDLAEELHNILNSYGIDARPDSCEVLAAALTNSNADGAMTAETVITVLGATEIVILESDETTETTVTLTADVFAEKTQLVFADSIKVNYDKPADTHKESALLADSFIAVKQVADKALAGEEFNPKTIVVDFGHLIDCFNATHTFGAESSRNLLICVLQSDYALETLRIDTIQVTHLARSIADTAKDESYANVLENIIRAIDILDGASNNEDVVGQIQDLIVNMTPATSTTLQQFTSPDNMQNFGIPERSAEQTSGLVSNIFNNLSDAKESGTLTDEEYKAEAEAVSDIINIAMNATGEGASGDTLFNENQTVTSFVDRVTDSKVMGQTIVDTVYDENGNKTVDPLNSTVTLSDSDTAELLEAMNKNLAKADEANKEETQKTLEAIAALVNVNVELVNGEFVIPGFSN